jgi:hypothetical protein
MEVLIENSTITLTNLKDSQITTVIDENSIITTLKVLDSDITVIKSDDSPIYREA